MSGYLSQSLNIKILLPYLLLLNSFVSKMNRSSSSMMNLFWFTLI